MAVIGPIAKTEMVGAQAQSGLLLWLLLEHLALLSLLLGRAFVALAAPGTAPDGEDFVWVARHLTGWRARRPRTRSPTGP